MSYTICLLYAVSFLDLLAVSLIVPLLPSHVRKLNGNEIQIGLLGSIYAGFQLMSGPLLGSLGDLKGRKSVLIMTLLVCGVTYTCLGQTDSIFVILAIRAVLGVFKQTQVLTRALVPDYEKNKYHQGGIYGKMAAISGLGMTLGPIVGGHIAEDNPEHGFTYVSYIVGCCFVLNACLVVFLPSIKRKRQTNSIAQRNVVKNMYRSLQQSFIDLCQVEWSKYWDIFIFKSLVGFSMGVYYSNYSFYLKQHYGLTAKYRGYVISFQGIIGSVSSYFIGYINSFYAHDKDYCIRNLHVFVLLSTAISGIMLSYNVYVYSFWLIPLSIGNAIGRLVTLEMVLKNSRGAHTGKLIGASNSVRSLSGVFAPILSGLISEYLGVTYAIAASLCTTLIGVMLGYIYKRKVKID